MGRSAKRFHWAGGTWSRGRMRRAPGVHPEGHPPEGERPREERGERRARALAVDRRGGVGDAPGAELEVVRQGPLDIRLRGPDDLEPRRRGLDPLGGGELGGARAAGEFPVSLRWLTRRAAAGGEKSGGQLGSGRRTTAKCPRAPSAPALGSGRCGRGGSSPAATPAGSGGSAASAAAGARRGPLVATCSRQL